MGGAGSGRKASHNTVVARLNPIATIAGGDPLILPNTSGIAKQPQAISTFARRELYNGSFRETFNALATSDGSSVTMTLIQAGGGDLTMQFSDGDTCLNCTSQEIELTTGTDASPQANYIYITQSSKSLQKSLTAWPTTEHIKVSYFLVPSATFVQSNGTYINQNWNDHLTNGDNQGHWSHLGERMRRDHALYFSGVDGNGTDGYLSPTASNVELKATTGVIYQMHRHTVPAFDTSSGDEVLVKNWSGDAYHNITNLFDITADSTGTTIGTNKFFNLILWGVGNKTGEYEPMMINLPGGFYTNQAGAEGDIDGLDDFAIPREFNNESSTGYLIARITIQMGTTWSVIGTVDLRGQTPAHASGGVGGNSKWEVDGTETQLINPDAIDMQDEDLLNANEITAQRLTIENTGTTGSAYEIKLTSPNPDIEFVENDQTSPAGKFELAVNGNDFQINSRNNADDSFETIMDFDQLRQKGSGGHVRLNYNLSMETNDIIGVNEITSVKTIIENSGDCDIDWLLTGVARYRAGIDDSDADKWKLGDATGGKDPYGTDNWLSVDPTTKAISGINITSGANPGHTHTGTSLSSIDISDDTNLVAGTNITLSGDTLNVDDAFLKNDASDTMSGTLTASNFIVQNDNNTNDTEYVPMVLHGTDATPPTASGFPGGTLYIQYTA